jgi:hypothetical protein
MFRRDSVIAHTLYRTRFNDVTLWEIQSSPSQTVEFIPRHICYFAFVCYYSNEFDVFRTIVPQLKYSYGLNL